jgi:beta-glucanase (GH16 family)
MGKDDTFVLDGNLEFVDKQPKRWYQRKSTKVAAIIAALIIIGCAVGIPLYVVNNNKDASSNVEGGRTEGTQTPTTQPTVGKPNIVGNCKSGVFPNNPARMRNSGWTKSGGIDASVNVNQHDWILEYGAANLKTSAGDGFEMSLINQPGQVASGITITSTRYMHYGKVSVNLKAINVPGAITTFITMSDIGDEIDYEITGNPVQPNTNVFYQTNGKTGTELEHFQHFTALSGLDMNVSHKYTIDWKHDSIEWLVDEKSVRFLKKSESFSAVNKSQTWFPETPSLVQFGVWDASFSSDPKTTEWVKY